MASRREIVRPRPLRLPVQFGAYKDLAKLVEFGAFLLAPVAWSLLPHHDATAWRPTAIVALMLLVVVGVRTAESALDDVAGIRDGIDAVNYANVSQLRARKRKPILDGRLTESQALGYAAEAVTCAGVALLAAAALARFSTWWPVAVAIVMGAAVVGYSWGPRLSYRPGGQEFVVILGLTGMLCATYGMATGGDLTARVVVEGLILGVWLMQPVTFANVHDRDGDRQAGRKTMAVKLSPRGHRAYVLGLIALGWALAVGGALTVLPWWLLLLTLPAIALQASAAVAVSADRDPLRARRNCHRAYRVGAAGIVVANLIVLF